MLKLLRVQFQVIRALTIRELQSQQSNLAYGLGWVFFDAFLAFAGLMIMKFAIRSFNKPGLPPITYLVSGLVPWMLFNSTYNAPGSAIKSGKNLLLLPVVTELDLVIAAALKAFLIYSVLFIMLSVGASLYEGVPPPKYPLGILLLFFSMSLMGVSFGFFVMFLSRLYEPAAKFVGFFMRFSMIFSGVVFPLTMFPPSVWVYLTWNPLLHIEELLRTYWLYSYSSPVGSPGYIAECLLGMGFFGLLLERYVRRRLPA